MRGQPFRRWTSIELALGEAVTLKAVTSSEFFVFGLPCFTEAAASTPCV